MNKKEQVPVSKKEKKKENNRKHTWLPKARLQKFNPNTIQFKNFHSECYASKEQTKQGTKN